VHLRLSGGAYLGGFWVDDPSNEDIIEGFGLEEGTPAWAKAMQGLYTKDLVNLHTKSPARVPLTDYDAVMIAFKKADIPHDRSHTEERKFLTIYVCGMNVDFCFDTTGKFLGVDR